MPIKMRWTRRAYDALHEWINEAKRPMVRSILLDAGLADVVARLDAAENLGEWYAITRDAAEAIGPRQVEASAHAADAELASRSDDFDAR